MLLGDEKLLITECETGVFNSQVDMETATNMLLNTPWENAVQFEKRNNLLQLMNMQDALLKVMQKSEKQASEPSIVAKNIKIQDELESYESLVRDAGMCCGRFIIFQWRLADKYCRLLSCSGFSSKHRTSV